MTRFSSALSHDGVLGAVGNELQQRKREKARRQALDQEEPLPALQTGDAVHGEKQARERTDDDEGERARGHEARDGARAALLRKPVGEIEHDARKESGFGDAQEKAQDVEARRPLHEGAGGRDRAPDDEDREHPAPRAEAHEHQIGGHLEQRIADEEDAGAEAEDGRREAEIGVHRQRREADIHPVDEADEIEQPDERDQPPLAFGEDLVFGGHWVGHAADALASQRTGISVPGSGRRYGLWNR